MLNIHVNIVRRLFIIHKSLSKAHNLVRIYTEREQKETYLVMSSRVKITKNSVFINVPQNTPKTAYPIGQLKTTAATANRTTH